MLGTLCGSLLLSALLRLLSTRARAIGTEVKRVHQDMWDHMMVTLQGMRTIRAFGQEETHRHRFDVSSAAARDVDLKGMQLTLILDHGVMSFDPVSFILPHGELSGKIRIDARGRRGRCV